MAKEQIPVIKGFNEIFRLNQLNISPIEKLNLVKQYSDSQK